MVISGNTSAAAQTGTGAVEYSREASDQQYHHQNHHHHHHPQQGTHFDNHHDQQQQQQHDQQQQQQNSRASQKRPLEESWSTTANMNTSSNNNYTKDFAGQPRYGSSTTTGGNHNNHRQSPLPATGGTASARITPAPPRREPRPVTAFALLAQSLREKEEESCKALHLIPAPNAVNATSSYNNNNRPQEWLRLGLGITELAGEAGSGKSQMAMHLCVQAVLQQQHCPAQHHTSSSPRTTKAIYISLSGGQASLSRIAHRMQQISDAHSQQQQQQHDQHQTRGHPHPRHNQQQHSLETPAAQDHNLPYAAKTSARPTSAAATDNNAAAPPQPVSESVLSQILTHSVRNQDDLFALLRDDLPRRLQEQQQPQGAHSNEQFQGERHHSHPVALIVLDSIADLFRLGNGDGVVDEDKMAVARRSFLLFEIASILKELSDRYRIPILVINQVSTDLNSNSTIPTLGLSWKNCVNASYLLRRLSQPLAGGGGGGNGSTGQASGASATGTTTRKPAPRRGRQIFLTKSGTHAVDRRAVFEIDIRGVVPAGGH